MQDGRDLEESEKKSIVTKSNNNAANQSYKQKRYIGNNIDQLIWCCDVVSRNNTGGLEEEFLL